MTDETDNGYGLAKVAGLRSATSTLEGDLWDAVLAARKAGCPLRPLAAAAGVSVTTLARKLEEER